MNGEGRDRAAGNLSGYCGGTVDMVCGGDPAPAAPTDLQDPGAEARSDSRPVPEKIVVTFFWILTCLFAMLVGMVMGYIVGQQSAKAPEIVHDPTLDSLSPAERRRLMNRPWT